MNQRKGIVEILGCDAIDKYYWDIVSRVAVSPLAVSNIY